MTDLGISNPVNSCLRLFQHLRSVDSPTASNASNQSILSSLREEEARFKVWVGNIGAHKTGRSSLEYRLRDASHIQKQVVELIADLTGLVEDARAIIAGEKTPWDELEGDDESLLDEMGLEADSDDDEFPETELGQITTDVADVINCLLRLSVAIRNPAPHDRFAASGTAIDTDHFEPFDIQHVEGKFSQVDKDLATRLGKAISRRRQYFKYRESHHSKLSEGISAEPSAPKDTVSTIASSIPEETKGLSFDPTQLASMDEDAISDSGVSQTSFASSIAETETLKIPPLPKEAEKGPFECPFCFMMIRTTTTISWRRHVFGDLRPYICLSEECTETGREFSRRHEWTAHELQNHWKRYVCPGGCDKTFSSALQCRSHLGSAHSNSIPPNQMDAMISLSARPMGPEDGINCPLCQEPLSSFKQYQRHVGRHQEQLALFALPPLDSQDDKDDDGDNTSQSEHGGSGSEAADLSVHADGDAAAVEDESKPEDDWMDRFPSLPNDSTIYHYASQFGHAISGHEVNLIADLFRLSNVSEATKRAVQRQAKQTLLPHAIKDMVDRGIDPLFVHYLAQTPPHTMVQTEGAPQHQDHSDVDRTDDGDFVLSPDKEAIPMFNAALFAPEGPSMVAGFSQFASQERIDAFNADWPPDDITKFIPHGATAKSEQDNLVSGGRDEGFGENSSQVAQTGDPPQPSPSFEAEPQHQSPPDIELHAQDVGEDAQYEKPEDDVILLKYLATYYPAHFPAHCIGDGKLLVKGVVDRVRTILPFKIFGLGTNEIRLLYEGRHLAASDTPVRDYGIKNNSEVQVVMSDPTSDGKNESSETAGLGESKDTGDISTEKEELEHTPLGARSEMSSRPGLSPFNSTLGAGAIPTVTDDVYSHIAFEDLESSWGPSPFSARQPDGDEQLAAAKEKGSEEGEMDIDPTDEIKLYGGIHVDGRPAELIRVKKNGKAISMATGKLVEIHEDGDRLVRGQENTHKRTEPKPRLGMDGVALLEREFSKNPEPNSSFRQELAEKVGVEAQRINNWYEFRRAKEQQMRKMGEFEAQQAKNETSSSSAALADQLPYSADASIEVDGLDEEEPSADPKAEAIPSADRLHGTEQPVLPVPSDPNHNSQVQKMIQAHSQAIVDKNLQKFADLFGGLQHVPQDQMEKFHKSCLLQARHQILSQLQLTRMQAQAQALAKDVQPLPDDVLKSSLTRVRQDEAEGENDVNPLSQGEETGKQKEGRVIDPLPLVSHPKDSSKSDETDIDDVEFKEDLIRRWEHRRRRLMTSGSIGKRTISESTGSDTNREDLKDFLDSNDVGSSARRLRQSAKSGEHGATAESDAVPVRRSGDETPRQGSITGVAPDLYLSGQEEKKVEGDTPVLENTGSGTYTAGRDQGGPVNQEASPSVGSENQLPSVGDMGVDARLIRSKGKEAVRVSQTAARDVSVAEGTVDEDREFLSSLTKTDRENLRAISDRSVRAVGLAEIEDRQERLSMTRAAREEEESRMMMNEWGKEEKRLKDERLRWKAEEEIRAAKERTQAKEDEKRVNSALATHDSLMELLEEGLEPSGISEDASSNTERSWDTPPPLPPPRLVPISDTLDPLIQSKYAKLRDAFDKEKDMHSLAGDTIAEGEGRVPPPLPPPRLVPITDPVDPGEGYYSTESDSFGLRFVDGRLEPIQALEVGYSPVEDAHHDTWPAEEGYAPTSEETNQTNQTVTGGRAPIAMQEAWNIARLMEAEPEPEPGPFVDPSEAAENQEFAWEQTHFACGDQSDLRKVAVTRSSDGMFNRHTLPSKRRVWTVMSNDDCNREDCRLYRHVNLDDGPNVRRGSGTSGPSRPNEESDERRHVGTIQQELFSNPSLRTVLTAEVMKEMKRREEDKGIPSLRTVLTAQGMKEMKKREEDKERQTNLEAMRRA